MTFIGCDNGDEFKNINDGIFTLDGIPSKYNGRYAGLSSTYTDIGHLNGAQNITIDSVTLAHISNGKVKIPMWIINGNNISRYYGNDTVRINVFLCDLEMYYETLEVASIYFDSVTFSNGGATKSFRDASSLYEADNTGGLSGTWKRYIDGNSVTLRANTRFFVITTYPYYESGIYSIVDNTFSLVLGSSNYKLQDVPMSQTGVILNSNTIAITFTHYPLFPKGTYTFYKQ